MNNNKISFELGTENGIILPNRFFIILILLTLFMVLVLSSGWNNMSLFYLALLIVFFIFFDIIPYNEQFSVGNQQLLNQSTQIKVDCEKYKNNALDNINKYMQCNNDVKPRVICPKQFQSTDDITNYAKNNGDLIQSSQFLNDRQPHNADRVCGIIPGIAANKIPSKKDTLLSDKELIKLMKQDITLHQVKEELENKLIADPLDLDIQKKLNIIEHEIIKLKPTIIYNLRAKNKTVGFVKNALM